MQFKVGDWVIPKVADDFKPRKITKIVDNDFIESEDLMGYMIDFELWQPKEGEWCWFWNYTDTPNFMMFNGITEDNLYNGITCIGGCDIEFDYCEPFIGELPSFIKDK